MIWKGRRGSANVEDRRGGVSRRAGGVGGGLGTIVLVLAIYLLGGDPSAVLDNIDRKSVG